MNDCLPQGGPCSGTISNLIMREVDDRVGDFAEQRDYRYTRYADDLFFSSNKPIDLYAVDHFVQGLLDELGLSINHAKSKSMGFGIQPNLCGIVITEEKNSVSQKYRREIRKKIYYLEKFGIHEASKHDGVSEAYYISRLQGCIGFVLWIMPKNEEFINYKRKIKEYIV